MLFSRLLSIAEETLTDFLAKATGTAVDWIQLPGMKVRTPFLRSEPYSWMSSGSGNLYLLHLLSL
jgi:hypothetical protein